MIRALVFKLALVSLFVGVAPARAVDLPEAEEVSALLGRRSFNPGTPPRSLRLRLEPIATGLEQPIYVAAAPEDRRLFVIERTGRLRVIENGDLRAAPFLDLRERIDWAGERGLLGLAFAPDYARTGRFYVAYSEKESFATIVARVRADVSTAVADPSSMEEILRIEQVPGRIDHKAGWIGFRPGEPEFLYIASGDGGGHNDPDRAAQSLMDRRGKILRVDVSGTGAGFTVPKGNPFAGRSDALPEIWALGVRNPFRVSFDRKTGDLFFGDVGQDAREELNYEPGGTPGGRNYGWRIFEGNQRNPEAPEAAPRNLVAPILSYAHEEMMFMRGCVIGGYVYRGAAIPELQGAYFFGDFTNARVYSLRCAAGKATDLTDWTPQLNIRGESVAYSGLASFGEDADGELYVVDFAGTVSKIARSGGADLGSRAAVGR